MLGLITQGRDTLCPHSWHCDRYIDRTNLKPILSPILDVTCNILVAGYGQSSLGDELYDMGYKKVTCLDFADVQVKNSSVKSKGANRDGVHYVTWDASAPEGLAFPHKPYDIVIDKVCPPQRSLSQYITPFATSAGR
jgi:2-polyprenyl-3-methyl-5-hydroxy-6-metoxy-1,4-benzoquinol methylase